MVMTSEKIIFGPSLIRAGTIDIIDVSMIDINRSGLPARKHGGILYLTNRRICLPFGC